MANLIELSEAIIGIELPPNITSNDRLRQILNDDTFRNKYQIQKILFEIRRESHAHIGALYLNREENYLLTTGSDNELISEKPIIIAYTDGGIEYLDNFYLKNSYQPLYTIKLITPNSTLTYHHPIKNKKLIDFIFNGKL